MPKEPGRVIARLLMGLMLWTSLANWAQQPSTNTPSGNRRTPPPWAATLHQELKITSQFDEDKNGWLNSTAERKAARQWVADEAKRNPSGRPVPRAGGEPTSPGPKVSPEDVKKFPGLPTFDPDIVRTLFLEFEDPDWEKALTDFRFTDVDLPAKLTVDGQVYHDVGVHCRGASSFLFVAEGRKRSLNISLDFVHKKQHLGGYRTLNLLNSNADPTFLRGILYYQVAREYTPAPKANLAKLVINGEYWGVYVNTQQEDKDFVQEWWKTKKGTRWKAQGSPWGRADFSYQGEDPAEYRKVYELHSKDDPKAWSALIRLCKTLTQTPLDRLEQEVAPLLNIEAALKFLALEAAFINDDGYWVRASDYNLYLDEKGQFHIFPHDGNEAFYDAPPHMRGGAARGADLDPFIGADDPNKVLLSRLVAVPSLRARYLTLVKDIATKWLDWNRLGPIARNYHALIDADVRRDSRKLESYESFRNLLEKDLETNGPRGPMKVMSLKTFADQRREFLLSYPDIKKLP